MELHLQPSAKTPLPPEIWMHVAEFIPHTTLCSMFSINRIFFELSMDARYGVLMFNPALNAETMRRRIHRVRDPSIAHRVRHLSFNLRYRNELLHQFNGESGIAWLEDVEMMTETVTYLTNITEFSVQLMDLPFGAHIIPLLTGAWKSFGSRLHKLSFQVSLKDLAMFLSAADSLVSLRDLRVKVSGKEYVETHSEALTTALAPFINKVAPTLRNLSYSSALDHLDLSKFFHRLEKIANLERLCISIEHFGSTLTEPFSASHFLYNHATTLRHLEWDEGFEHSGKQYLMNLQSGDKLFSNLYTLKIQVPATPGAFSMMVQHLRCSAETLTSLIFYDWTMTYEEASTLMSPFAPLGGGNLKELSFWVEFLSPELILLLAQTLPRLEKLIIHAIHVTGCEEEKRILDTIDEDDYESREREERLNAGIFAEAMRTCDLPDWALRDISIDAGSGFDNPLNVVLMLVLAECVPSVKTFRGRGKELSVR